MREVRSIEHRVSLHHDHHCPSHHQPIQGLTMSARIAFTSARIPFTVLIGTVLVAIASAQTSSDSTPPPAQSFAEAKAQHVARLEKELACIEAATGFDMMRACAPPPPGGHFGPPPRQ
jgi:hypothetical protein